MNRPPRHLDLLAQMSHFAIWPTLYAIGVYVLLSKSLPGEHHIGLMPVLFIAICTHASYLLDRVKTSDSRLDEADAVALPRRAQSLSRHTQAIRRFIGLELLVASAIGLALHPILTVIPLISLIAIHGYAGRTADPDKPRLKDLPACKPFFIATSHIALPVAVIWASPHSADSLNTLTDQTLATLSNAIIVMGVWFIVVGDAMLCDIDDLDTDRIFGTRSFAVLFGAQHAWLIAFVCVSAGSVLLGFAWAPSRWAAFALIASTLLTRNSTNHRDFVDARLLPIALLTLISL